MYIDNKGVRRSSRKARHLFRTDLTIDKNYDRWIPDGGAFGSRDILVSGEKLTYHIGTDYGADIGEDLIAFYSGEVTRVIQDTANDYGKQVFIYMPAINKTAHYAHMSTIAVSVGQKVSTAQVIGKSGNTGLSQGPHLHFSFGNGRITTTSKNEAWIDFEQYSLPAPSPAKTQYINLFNKDKYRVYRENETSPVVGREVGFIEPTMFEGNGLSYVVRKSLGNNMYLIHTDFYGNVQVYLDPSYASLSDKPKFSNKSKAPDRPALKLVPETGFLFYPDRRLNVYDYPDANKLTMYHPGEFVDYEGYTVYKGYIWIYYTKNGQKRFVCTRPNGGKPWGEFRPR